MRMASMVGLLAVGVAAISGSVSAQVENGDFRVKADFRTPDNGAWGARESVGNADFRIHSRFLQLYYGGVMRNDDFKFSVQISFADISGFATEFAGSPYNVNYDLYINQGFVGRAIMNSGLGVAELTYDSRHAEFPDLPLPANFPEPVNAGDTVRVFFAAAVLPEVGDALPSGTPVFSGTLEEKFSRGDVDQDGNVDLNDFAILAANYDPHNLVGPHIGPARGDFSGDSVANITDYNVMADNWTDRDPIPAEPAPIAVPPCVPDFDHNGTVSIQDTFDFLSAYFLSAPTADVNNSGTVTVQDIFDFLTAYFTGC